MTVARRSQPTVIDYRPRGVINLMFLFWILSLPFYHFSVIGTLSVDNLLAPLLLFLWFFTRTPNDAVFRRTWRKTVVISIALVVVFIIGIVISFWTDLEVFFAKGYLSARRALYFFLPLLFIRDWRTFNRVCGLVIAITVIGGVTALLASLEVISPVVVRTEQSRLDIETLQKAVGFFSNYGDMAMLMCFTILLTLFQPKQRYFFGIGGILTRTIVAAAMLMGIAGSQSRNMILTTIVGVLAYLTLRYLYKQRPLFRVVVAAGLGTLAAFAAVGVLFFAQEIIDGLGRWGGEGASGTARARLAQYEVALRFLNEAFISGVSIEAYNTYGPVLDAVHNMWLYLMVQGGVISTLAMILLLWRAFAGAVQRGDKEPFIAPEAFCTGALVVGMVNASMFYAGSTEVFWFLLGVATSIASLYLPNGVGGESTRREVPIRTRSLYPIVKR